MTQPNTVIILADDMGWIDVGYHGSGIKTPVLDNLASEGARLNQFYVMPACTRRLESARALAATYRSEATARREVPEKMDKQFRRHPQGLGSLRVDYSK